MGCSSAESAKVTLLRFFLSFLVFLGVARPASPSPSGLVTSSDGGGTSASGVGSIAVSGAGIDNCSDVSSGVGSSATSADLSSTSSERLAWPFFFFFDFLDGVVNHSSSAATSLELVSSLIACSSTVTGGSVDATGSNSGSSTTPVDSGGTSVSSATEDAFFFLSFDFLTGAHSSSGWASSAPLIGAGVDSEATSCGMATASSLALSDTGSSTVRAVSPRSSKTCDPFWDFLAFLAIDAAPSVSTVSWRSTGWSSI
ncbi:hypothetical protein PG994_010549 [Apiospora phragmitis]|uniref:Secreted protein n=1 Tax=Apiospora phragmitis TaxID=2905665 RepID=A0ABR1TQC4_9PEZI